MMKSLIGTVVKCSAGTLAGLLRVSPYIITQLIWGKRLPSYHHAQSSSKDESATEQFGVGVLKHDDDNKNEGPMDDKQGKGGGGSACYFQDIYLVSTDGTRLHAVMDNGSRRVKGKRPIVFVHGFPELWISWLEQLKYFSASGHPVLALSMRGYGLSDKPKGRRSGLEPYHLYDCIVEDVRAAVQYVTKDSEGGGGGGTVDATMKPLLVGHDWGASVCWMYASQGRTTRDGEIAGYVSLAIPPLECFEANMSLKQLWASLYMIFFNMPWLPEAVFLANNAWLVAVMMNATKRAQLPLWMINTYRANCLQPGAMTAQLNYYRSAFQQPPKPDPADVLGPRNDSKNTRRLEFPCLLIRGKDDDALTEDVFVGYDRYLSNSRLVSLDNCSHWIQADCPNEVNQEIDTILGEL
jgi:epoxide hydrolase 4